MRTFCVRWFFPWLIFQLSVFGIEAQENDSTVIPSKLPGVFSIDSDIHYGFVFAHSPLVENTKGAKPTGVEVSFSWQKNDAATWDLCNCYPRRGLMIAYYDYDSRILGRSIGASYFLEPNYKLGKRNFFFIKAAAGLAYMTSPFDSVKNPTNMSYSSAVSGYLLVGIGLWFRLNDRWWLNSSANYQHISNGGLSQPNKGINWPTLGIGVRYQNDTRDYYTGPRTKEKFWKNNSIRWDIGIFGITRKGTDELGNRKRQPLFGLGLQASKQVGRINRILASTEMFYDENMRIQLKRDSTDASAIKAGIAFGHEFVLGKFLFSQRLGVYVFDQTPYYDRIFHRWGIHYMTNSNWGVGVSLLAHRHVADFVDLRLTYSIRN